MKPTTCSVYRTTNASIIKWMVLFAVAAMLLALPGCPKQPPAIMKKPDPLELRLDPL